MEEIIIFSVIISRKRLIQEIELINLGGEMKKFSFILIAIIASFSTVVFAGPKIEVLHWWTSGGEAAALKVLKDDFAANGGEWLDMPVTGGGGDAANVTLKARIVAGDPPSASQIKGPTIQEYDQEGVVAPYNIDAVA